MILIVQLIAKGIKKDTKNFENQWLSPFKWSMRINQSLTTLKERRKDRIQLLNRLKILVPFLKPKAA